MSVKVPEKVKAINFRSDVSNIFFYPAKLHSSSLLSPKPLVTDVTSGRGIQNAYKLFILFHFSCLTSLHVH